MIIHIKGNWNTKKVWLNGKLLNIKKSQKVRYHSEQFNWGYAGSGPAQLALAIWLELFQADARYQAFKFRYIAALPQDKDIDQDLDLTEFIEEMGLKIVDNFNTKFKD